MYKSLRFKDTNKLLRTLELFRVSMGQGKYIPEYLGNIDFRVGQIFEDHFKYHYFPELPPNGNYGIAHKKTDRVAKVAHGVFSQIRYITSWHNKGKDPEVDERDRKEMFGVNYDPPLELVEHKNGLPKVYPAGKTSHGDLQVDLMDKEQMDALKYFGELGRRLKKGDYQVLNEYFGNRTINQEELEAMFTYIGVKQYEENSPTM